MSNENDTDTLPAPATAPEAPDTDGDDGADDDGPDEAEASGGPEPRSGRWTGSGSGPGPRLRPSPSSPPPARAWRPGAVHAGGPGVPDADRTRRAADAGLPHASGAAAVAGARSSSSPSPASRLRAERPGRPRLRSSPTSRRWRECSTPRRKGRTPSSGRSAATSCPVPRTRRFRRTWCRSCVSVRGSTSPRWRRCAGRRGSSSGWTRWTASRWTARRGSRTSTT